MTAETPRRRTAEDCLYCDEHAHEGMMPWHYCDEHAHEGMMPWHDASQGCESGKHPHCTCDTCF